MQFNDKFTMRDLFTNRDLKHIFPQFNQHDPLQNVYSFAWFEKKIANYLKDTFNGRINRDTTNGYTIRIQGKFKQRFAEIKALQGVIEVMFNNIPSFTKGLRQDTKVILPFQSLEQIKTLDTERAKIQVMQIVFDNIQYNPDFGNQYKLMYGDYYKKQMTWLKTVGYEQLKGISYE